MAIEDKITRKICDICYEGSSEDEREVVEYGIALLVETAFKFALMLILSVFIGKVWETVSFILVFCAVRSNAGGIHCRTNAGCSSSLFAIYFLGLGLDYVSIAKPVVLILFLICFLICLIWAPSSTDNNPISELKIRALKKTLTLGLLSLFFIEYSFSIVGLAKGAILSTYISISVLVILQELMRNKKVNACDN